MQTCGAPKFINCSHFILFLCFFKCSKNGCRSLFSPNMWTTPSSWVRSRLWNFHTANEPQQSLLYRDHLFWEVTVQTFWFVPECGRCVPTDPRALRSCLEFLWADLNITSLKTLLSRSPRECRKLLGPVLRHPWHKLESHQQVEHLQAPPTQLDSWEIASCTQRFRDHVTVVQLRHALFFPELHIWKGWIVSNKMCFLTFLLCGPNLFQNPLSGLHTASMGLSILESEPKQTQQIQMVTSRPVLVHLLSLTSVKSLQLLFCCHLWHLVLYTCHKFLCASLKKWTLAASAFSSVHV